MKLDYLFQRRADPTREEPSLDSPRLDARGLDARRLDAPGRSLVAFGRSHSAEPEGDEEFSAGTYWDPPAARFSVQYNSSAMSPRQFSDWAHEMYICRKLAWEEYRVVGFPAELHPDYNRTVGALTGSRAEPDRPRDMIGEWEERLAFARRHNDANGPEVKRTAKVLSLLKKDDDGQTRKTG